MINCKRFFDLLKSYGFNPFIEVPCSILAPIINYAWEDPEIEVINPVNESVAVGIAAGAYLAGKKPIVAVQNSGFLNTLNPLTSLHLLYKIPFLFLISWRGHPEEKDAPEHLLVGRDMLKYLQIFGIPSVEIKEPDWEMAVQEANEYITNHQMPFALLIRRGVFENYDNKAADTVSSHLMTRYEAIKMVKNSLINKALFISTNGYITRESYDITQSRDFYMVGSMGMALPIGIGLAEYTRKKVVILDGDGAILMHLGGMTYLAKEPLPNLIHVVLDNESYASTKGQEALSKYVRLVNIAREVGYKSFYFVMWKKELEAILSNIESAEGPVFIHIKVKPGNKKGVKRVSDDCSCEEIKTLFMREVIR